MRKDRNEKKLHSLGLQELTSYPESQRTEQVDDWTARFRDQEERALKPHVHITTKRQQNKGGRNKA